MLRNRLSRIALAAVLAFGVLAIGTTQSSAIDTMNGFQGPYRVIKSFALVAFEYGAWKKKHNQQAIEHECQPVKEPMEKTTCYLNVARQVFFDNCTTGAADAAECNVGEAQPHGGGPLPEGFGSMYVCPKGAIVKTVSNLLFIPQTCIDQDDS